MNKVILMGRLTRDPAVRTAGSGDQATKVANYSIAVDRKRSREGDPTADFFNCTSFGKQAEFVEKYLKKSTKVLLSGRIQNDNYTNKDGQQVYSVNIMVEEIEFAESKKNDQTTGESQAANDTPAQQAGSSVSANTAPADSYAGEYDDELPFS